MKNNLHVLSSAAGTTGAPEVMPQSQAKLLKDTSKASPAKAAAPLQLTRTFVYTNFRGLHARPAALLVKQLARYKCSVIAQCNGEPANAKSILGLLCLAVGSQSKVTFTATGADAPEAMAAIEHLFENQFDEAY